MGKSHPAELFASDSKGSVGQMPAKIFHSEHMDRAETVLQGVAIWLGRNYGDRLVAPNCPAIEAESSNSGGSMSMHRNMELRPNLIKNLKKK